MKTYEELSKLGRLTETFDSVIDGLVRNQSKHKGEESERYH
jgi:hypothetical protein